MESTPYFHQSDVARRTGTTFKPTQLTTAYGFPAGLDGSGQKVAFIELGGGFKQTDINNYLKYLGLFPRGNYPTVQSVSVGGAHNSPTNANSADSEVMLDICVALAVAPGITPIVYFAHNTTAGFAGAITQAVHDKVNIISISWGGPEDDWSTDDIQTMETALISAKNAGITVFVAAGDSGSTDGERGSHVDYPASSPYVTACGGTTLTVNSSNAIVTETVWNSSGATGGGVSTLFAIPSYQVGVGVPGNAKRGVPDVAAVADPNTGYVVMVDGSLYVIGGTSAVAPLWAGATAVMNQGLKRNLGFLNPLLYPLAKATGAAANRPFHDITSGNNGFYHATTGWDACTGLGTPNFAKIMAALK